MVVCRHSSHADGLSGQNMACFIIRVTAFDYIRNTVRRRFGGRLHARNDGIKPFIQSVRQGYCYTRRTVITAREHSEFVDFFATYKATLPRNSS